MKRTCAVIGFSYMLGLILCNFVFEKFSIYFALIMLIVSIILSNKRARFKDKSLKAMFWCLFLSAALFSIVRYFSYVPTVGYADTKCEIEAVVLDTPSISSGENYSYLIKTKKINSKKKSIKMRLYVPYDICAEPYDEVNFTAYPFQIGSNDKGMLLHFRSKGTYLGVYTESDVRVHTPEIKPLMSVFPILKANSMKILKSFLDEKHAGFSISILFGDKILIDTETQTNFRRVGLTHIMAVSGLHMSVWVYGLYKLLNFIGISKKRSSVISIVFSVFVVCFSSFSVSVIRAMVMTGIYLSAGLFRRQSDALNSLGLAVLILCVTNPFVVCDVSFLLSVFATLGIIIASSEPPIVTDKLKYRMAKMNFEKKRTKYMTESLIISVAAMIFTYPIVVGIFGGISPISPIVNLLTIPVLSPCLLLSGSLTMFPSVDTLTYAVRHVLTFIENYIFFVVENISKLPFAYVSIESFFFCVAVPVITAVTLSVLYSRKDKSNSVPAICIAVSICVISIFYYV